MADEAEAALITCGAPIFCRGGALVRPIMDIVPAADTKPQPEPSTERATPPGRPRSFVILRPNELPPDVLRWSSAQEKGKLRRAWRLAVVKECGKRSRLLRLAWAVFELAATDGFASAGDCHLATKRICSSKTCSWGSLSFIVRVRSSGFTSARTGCSRRRKSPDYYATEHLSTPQRRGYSIPPSARGSRYPHGGGTERRRGFTAVRRRKLTAAGMASADAERRDGARGEGVENPFTDEAND